MLTVLWAAVPSSDGQGVQGGYWEDGVYCIECFEGLEELGRMVERSEGAFTGQVRLMRDIEAVRPLKPIGSLKHMFCGTFDGGGHTISNLSVQGTGEFEGLFGYVGNGGIVRDLTLHGMRVAGARCTGGIAAYSSGRIERCRVEAGRIIGLGRVRYGTATGGVVGLSNGELIECVNRDTRVEGGRCVGGVVGKQCAGSVERCANTGSVHARDEAEALCGGVAGSLQTGASMRSCVNTGRIFAPRGTWVGGVTGGLLGGGMIGCISTGEIHAREAGGAIGYAARRAQVMCCVYAGRPYPGVGEGRQDGMFILPGDEKRLGRAYELLRPLIENKEHRGAMP